MIHAWNEGNTLVINMHSGIGSPTFDEEDEDERNVGTVEELQDIIKKNKNVAKIDLYINSQGGSVFEGIGIYNILKRTRAYKRVFIDGCAASIASVIAMAGNAIYMPKSSIQMIHNAWTWTYGNAQELRKTADDLDKINSVVVSAYMSRFKGTEEELKNLLDNETYLTADECLQYGLCTKVTEDNEDTEEIASVAVDKMSKMLADKLKELEAIKNAVRDFDNTETTDNEETDEPETVKDGVEPETVKDGADSVKDSEPEVKVEEIEDKQEETLNELQRFFHVKKGVKN